MSMGPLDLLSQPQRDNVTYLSRMFFSLCNWNDESGPSRLVMTCFYTDHGDNALIVPQQRYNVPPEDWHSDEEYINWTLENSNPSSITFRADGKFGLSIKSALLGTANITANTVDTRAKITPYFSLHIMYPGCSSCTLPVSGRSAFREDGTVNAAKLAQVVAEKVNQVVTDGLQPYSDDYHGWELENVSLDDIFLLQLKYVSPRDGWQPVLGLRKH